MAAAPAEPEGPLTVPDFLRERVDRLGDRELLVSPDARLTWAQAEARSARLAGSLLEAGAGKGTRVGLWLPNGPRWVVAWLATARIGALAVPVNTFYQPRELVWALRHADVQLLLCPATFLGHDLLGRLEAAAPGLAGARAGRLRVPEVPHLRGVYAWGEAARPWASDAAALDAGPRDATLAGDFLRAVEDAVAPADPLILLYSSGSTADPKGALHTHGAVLRHSRWLAGQRDVKGSDRVWSAMPFFWVGGFVFALLGNLQAGATTLCEETFEPGATLAFLERERATVALGWPHFGKALADHPTRRQRDLSSLRAGNLPEILPHVPPDPELRASAVGMTETCGPHTWGGEGALPERLRGTFGPAVEGVEHKVVDPATGRVLPPGELGEICVRGRSLMQGLYKREREEVFDADGFYPTGDAGWFDAEGLLHFVGRLGDMIKTAGANVTPSEVEAVLAALPEVKAAYVVGVPHPERGQNVAASVLLEPGASITAEELKRRVKAQLSAYKVPRHLWIDRDGALPFTDTGKIDKRRLARLLEGRIAAGDVG